ncbi:MAG TPA: FHA domain-containing protein [Ktedonobacterales bacterium]|nr:FHA domain-containing protein [Ktedonobacterales bacterium]
MGAHFAANAHAVLAASSGGLGGNVAVALGAVVVIVAIVLVFFMVMRSNGGSRKAANGLGYDAHQGPLGQPRDGAPGMGGRRQPPQSAGWADDDGYGAGPAPAELGNQRGPAGWGPGQDGQGNMGNMGGMPGPSSRGQDQWGAAPQGAAGWRDSAPNDGGQWGAGGNQMGNQGGEQWPPQAAGAWNAPQVNARDAANARPPAGGGWDAPSPADRGAGGWGQPPAAKEQAMPWDQPDASAPGWGATPSVPPQRDWAAPAAQQSPSAPAWGMDAPQPNGNWGPAVQNSPVSPNGADAQAFGDGDKTRVVRPAGAPRVGMIVVRQGKEPGRIFEVRKERLTIGRSRESDIFLEDLAVSRLHTTVARAENGQYILRDENSANGTYVNGKKINEHILDEGDEIQVGQTVLRFVGR